MLEYINSNSGAFNFFASLLICIVTLAYVILTGFIMSASRKMLTAAMASTASAQKSAETAERSFNTSVRPYLAVEKMVMKHPTLDSHIIVVRMKNYGAVPAKIEGFEVRLSIQDPNGNFNQNFQELGQGVVLPRDVLKLRCPLPSNEHLRIAQAGRSTIGVVTQITYRNLATDQLYEFFAQHEYLPDVDAMQVNESRMD